MTPAQLEGLDAGWLEFTQLVSRTERDYHALSERTQLDGRHFLHWDVRGTRRAGEYGVIRDAAGAMLSELIAQAENTLVPAGVALLIEPGPLYARWLGRDGPAPDFAPSAIWADLAARFGGNQGLAAAYASSADALVGFFGLAGDRSIQRRGAWTELEVSIFSESASDGRFGLGWRASERFRDVVPHLATLLAWAGLPNDLSEAVAQLATTARLSHSGFKSRQTHRLMHAQVTLFKAKVVFRLDATLADALNGFVGEFSQRLAGEAV